MTDISKEELDLIFLSWEKFYEVKTFLNAEFALHGIAIPDKWADTGLAGDTVEFPYNGATIHMNLMCRRNDTFGFKLYDLLNSNYYVDETIPYNNEYKDVLRKHIECLIHN